LKTGDFVVVGKGNEVELLRISGGKIYVLGKLVNTQKQQTEALAFMLASPMFQPNEYEPS